MKRLLKYLKYVLFFVFIFSPLTLNANIEFDKEVVNNSTRYDTTLPDYNPAPVSQYPNLNFTTNNLGVYGPFVFGGLYSQEYGFIGKGQWTQGFGMSDAVSLLFEIGMGQRRLSGTFGHAFGDFNRLKFSAEYLQQDIRFDFDSGDVKEWISQGAYGASYQYLVSNGFFHAITMNAYYSNAPSKDLESMIFMDKDHHLQENFRRIAGGKDKTASIGVNLQPLKVALLGIELNYDQVKYEKMYDKHNEDVSGFGATLSWQQLITDRLKFKLSASNRKPNNNYEAEINWLCSVEPGSRLEVALVGTHLTGNAGLRGDNRFGLNVGYSFGSEPKGAPELYTLGLATNDESVAKWTATPAVYMSQVLAVKDQMNKVVTNPEYKVVKVELNINEKVNVDITEKLKPFGASKLKDVKCDGLAAYGLSLHLSADGQKVYIEGTTKSTPVGALLDLIVTNLADLTTVDKLELKILSIPVITSVSPPGIPAVSSTLQKNTTHQVIINGSGFVCIPAIPQPPLAVRFGSYEYVPTSQNCSSNQIKVDVDEKPAELVNVTVINPDKASATLAKSFGYAPKAAVIQVNPNQGSSKGGEQITVSGSGFKLDTLDITNHPEYGWGVYFGTSNTVAPDPNTAPSGIITSVTGSTITFKTPAVTTPPAHYYVWVLTAGGAPISVSAIDARFTFFEPPVPSSIKPREGKTAGREEVEIKRIRGGKFVAEDTYVRFGNSNWILANVVDDSTLTVRTPSNAKGEEVQVQVKTPGGIGTLEDKFRYVAQPKPVSIINKEGSIYGGYELTILGSDFYSTKADYSDVIIDFTIDGVHHTFNPNKGDTKSLTFTLPASITPYKEGAKPEITVTTLYNNYDTLTPGKQTGIMPSGSFTFVKPGAPFITSISPSQGSEYGGYTLMLTGGNFLCIDTNCGVIRLNNDASYEIPARPCGVLSQNICVDLPAKTGTPWYKATDPATAIDIGVVNPAPDGQSGIGKQVFKFLIPEPPHPAAISPESGSSVGGYNAIITGTNFGSDKSKLAVKFGGVAATIVSMDVPDKQITVAVPAYSGTLPQTVDVDITMPDYPDVLGKLANAFTYKQPAPAIFNVSCPNLSTVPADRYWCPAEPTDGTTSYNIALFGDGFVNTATAKLVIDGGSTYNLTLKEFISSQKIVLAFAPGTNLPPDQSTGHIVLTQGGTDLDWPSSLKLHFQKVPKITKIANVAGFPYSASNGSDPITISGSGFSCTSDIKVQFGDPGSLGTVFLDHCNSSSIDSILPPAHQATSTPITVTVINPHGIASIKNTASDFYYEDPWQISINPNHGHAGLSAKIFFNAAAPSGQNLIARIDTDSTATCKVGSGEYCDIIMPIHVSGLSNIQLFSLHGIISNSTTFTYDP